MNKYRPILEKYPTLESEQYNIVNSVINSIKQNESDYCYNQRDFQTILSMSKNINISFCYKVINDEEGEFDYCKFLPVQYYVKNNNVDTKVYRQYNYKEIPNDTKCVLIKKNVVKILKDYK